MKKTKRANGEGSIWTEIRNGRTYYRGAAVVGYELDGKPIRKTLGSFERQEVVKKLREMQVLVDKNLFIEPSKKPFADYFKDWIFNHKQSKIAASSFETYESEYRLRIKDSKLGKIKMENLNVTNLQQHFNELSINYPVTTVQKSYDIVKYCLNYAEKVEDIYKNPMKFVEIEKRRKTPPNRSMPMSASQQKIFVKHLDNDYYLDNFIYCALATGGRLGEITALSRDDLIGKIVHYNKQYRNIPHITSDGHRKWKKEITIPKSEKSNREVPITDATLLIFNKQMQINKRMANDPDNNFIDRNLIFCDENGNYIEKKRPARRVKTICEQIGLPPFTFHELRHSYATRLYEQGVPIRTIQLLLGHEDIRTTEIYVTVLDDPKKSAVSMLDGII